MPMFDTQRVATLTGRGNGATMATVLASGLAMRLCHDLSGPLVAVLSALEMAAEEAPPAEPDAPLAVAGACARHLAARLALLRAAWGMDTGTLDATRIGDLAEGLPNRGRISLDLGGMGNGTLDGLTGRIVLNMLLLAAAGLPKGGTIALGWEGRGFMARIQGPKVIWPEGLAGMLADPEASEPSPHNALPVLLGRLVLQGGLRVGVVPPTGAAGTVSAALRLSDAT